MVVRVPLDSLPEDVRKAIERGESVEFARDGDVVARIECASPSWKARLSRWAEEARTGPQVDYDRFLSDLEEIRQELNRPAELRSWE